MASVSEETIINKIAGHERAIAGVKNSYNFAQNPDSLSEAQLPAVLHLIPRVMIEPAAHHNIWRNEFAVQSVVIVVPRLSRAGKMRFIENETMVYMMKWRQRFQTETVVSDMLSTGTTKFFLSNILYGAGMPQLTLNGIEYVGLIATFDVVEIN